MDRNLCNLNGLYTRWKLGTEGPRMSCGTVLDRCTHEITLFVPVSWKFIYIFRPQPVKFFPSVLRISVLIGDSRDGRFCFVLKSLIWI